MHFDQAIALDSCHIQCHQREYHILGSIPDAPPSLHHERAKMELNWMGPLLTTSSNTRRIYRLVVIVADVGSRWSSMIISATTESTHTITVARANWNTTKSIADVELLKKILFINHRPRRTITGLVLHNFFSSIT